jgi:hypothetical protein
MGRPSRKRSAQRKRSRSADARPAARKATRPSAPPQRLRRPADPDARPNAPWHPFPLVELSVLVGLVLCVLGLLNLDSQRGRIMLGFGLLLGSLGGADTALREHFAGYRSHTTVLAGLPAVAVSALLFFVEAPWPVVSGSTILVFAGAFMALRNAFRRRSGGLTFR